MASPLEPLLVALLAPAAFASDLGFLPPLVLTFAEGTHPSQVLAFEVTGDDMPDLVIASGTQGLILVRNGEGGYEFGPPALTVLPAAVARWEAGDMNGDGLPDLVVRLAADDHVRVLLADGNGAFTNAAVLDVSTLGLFADLALLDADEDGRLDAALLQGGQIRIALGDGAGQLGAPGPGIDDPPLVRFDLDLHALAVNGDGHADLAAVGVDGFGGPAWGAYLGDGAGGFAPAPDPGLGSPDATTHASTLGDLDGDGWSDLAVSFQDGFSFFDPGTVQFARGTGGSLQGSYPRDVAPLPDDIGAIRVADLDGDGFGDLVGTAAWASAPFVWVFPGDGAFGFHPPMKLPVAADAGDISIADLDMDGVLDVVVTNESADALTVLRNTALPAGWSDLGGALAGSAGTPTLAGTGALLGGQPVRLRLTDAAPAAPVVLVAGFAHLDGPLKGGVLVPSADLVVAGLVTDAAGSLELHGRWPSGLPAGFALWMQEWIADAAGPASFAASNGVGAKTGP